LTKTTCYTVSKKEVKDLNKSWDRIKSLEVKILQSNLREVTMLKAIHRFRKSNKKGFTLIELLIVVAIIAILAAIAIPQFSAYRKRGYNASANSDLRNLRTSEEALYADFTDYGASGTAAAPGASTTAGAEVGPGGQVWLNGGRTTTTPQASSLSPGVYVAANVFYNGQSNTAYTIVTAHGVGDKFYGADSDVTTLYYKGMPTTGYTAGMALAATPNSTYTTDDFAALGTVWTPIQ
jgi:type IV pilus assembly protein PilA